MVQKTVAGSPDVTYHYFYNESWQVLEERLGDDPDPYAQYVWDARYIDAPILRWRDTSSPPDGQVDETLYFTNDANMNVTAAVDASSAVQERYTYDAYGTPTFRDASWNAVSWANSRKNEILFCGYRYDPQTGYYHVRRRVYPPNLGRWDRADPGPPDRTAPDAPAPIADLHAERSGQWDLLAPGSYQVIPSQFLRFSSEGPHAAQDNRYVDGMNLYQYAKSHPSGLVDPSGTDCCGPDATQAIKDVLANVDRDWKGWDWWEQNRHCSGMISGSGWDIVQLAAKTVRAEGCGTGQCKDTVVVRGKCYHQAQVNYVLWGHINRLCGNSLEGTLAVAAVYKLAKHGYVNMEAVGWTTAGWLGGAASVWSDFDHLCTKPDTVWKGKLDYTWSRGGNKWLRKLY